MAKKAKGVRMIVTLECTEQKGSGIPRNESVHHLQEQAQHAGKARAHEVQQVHAQAHPASRDQVGHHPMSQRPPASGGFF